MFSLRMNRIFVRSIDLFVERDEKDKKEEYLILARHSDIGHRRGCKLNRRNDNIGKLAKRRSQSYGKCLVSFEAEEEWAE